MHQPTSSPRGDDPVELTALRLLCIVFFLGDSTGEDDGRTLWGEPRLQALDHLLRQPDSLALWTLLVSLQRGIRGNPSALAKQLRELLRQPGGHRNAPPASRGLEMPPWRSLDDGLSYLTCRDLLRLTSRNGTAGTVERGYTSGPEAGPTVAQLTSRPGLGESLRKHCRLLSMALSQDPSIDLETAAQRLEAFVDAEQLAPEDDPAPRLFHSLFGEPL